MLKEMSKARNFLRIRPETNRETKAEVILVALKGTLPEDNVRPAWLNPRLRHGGILVKYIL